MSLSLLVIIHEGGHFLFARLFKVRVEKFCLFFDPWFTLFKFKPKRSDTEYAVGWLPLGGYVKIAGMIDESMDTEQMKQPEQPWEFRSKPAWQRLLIMVGGVLFNFLLALFIYSMILFAWGDQYIKVQEAPLGMDFNETAKAVGFQDGDILLSADNVPFVRYDGDMLSQIADAREVSVLRDGNLVMTKSTKDANMNELIAAMVGRSLDNRFPPVDNTPKDVILSIQHLSTKFEPHLQDVSFDVREGEIFGLYGLVGAGRTELLETIFGVRTRAAGRVYFNNRLMNFNSAREAMEHGFAMITEERKANGLFLKGDLTFNTTIANPVSYTHLTLPTILRV